jgi:hypothetical protein
MGRKISIHAGNIKLRAELYDTPSAERFLRSLPVEGRAATWGEEVYCPVAIHGHSEDHLQDEVDIGEIGYWPPGKAVCIFYGATPASGADGKPRPAGPVQRIGRLLDDPARLRDTQDGDRLRFEPEP